MDAGILTAVLYGRDLSELTEGFYRVLTRKWFSLTGSGIMDLNKHLEQSIQPYSLVFLTGV